MLQLHFLLGSILKYLVLIIHSFYFMLVNNIVINK